MNGHDHKGKQLPGVQPEDDAGRAHAGFVFARETRISMPMADRSSGNIDTTKTNAKPTGGKWKKIVSIMKCRATIASRPTHHITYFGARITETKTLKAPSKVIITAIVLCWCKLKPPSGSTKKLAMTLDTRPSFKLPAYATTPKTKRIIPKLAINPKNNSLWAILAAPFVSADAFRASL